MANTNITNPIITFKVNLGADLIGTWYPDRFSSNADTGYNQAVQQKKNVSTLLPGLGNGGNCQDRVLHNDGTFTAYGLDAQYLVKNFTTGTNPLLTIVTSTFASA